MMRNNSILDDYLDFVQDNFNVNDVSFHDIARTLDELSKRLAIDDKQTKRDLDKLKDTVVDLKVIQDKELFNRFEEITGNFDIFKTDKIYGVTKDLIFDLENARDWLGEYNRFISNININSMDKLVALGKAILARAVELCPFRTGLLRSSGTLLIYKDYIVIAFQAPYATYVHENLEVSYKYGGAKFLERALQEFLPDKKTWIEIKDQDMVYAKITASNKVIYKH